MLQCFTLRSFLFILVLATFFPWPAAADPRSYGRSVASYSIPDVVLVNQDGERVRLKKLIESDRPVVVEFIYGTCTTICPVLSAGLAGLQKRLGPDSGAVHLVSISIDPENDTPRVMKEYLDRFWAWPGWDFLTGSRPDIDRVMRAFDAYFPNKMAHQPLHFIRAPKTGRWIRINGLMSGGELWVELEKARI